MPDMNETVEVLRRYLRARIPFVAIRSAEQQRALAALRRASGEMDVAIHFHTTTRGVLDLETNRIVVDERTVSGALDWATEQMERRQNFTIVFTEVTDLDDDGPLAQQFSAATSLANERGATLVVVGTVGINSTLQRMGMAVTLDPPTEDEMRELIARALDDYRAQLVIEWDEHDIRTAASILVGVSEVEAQNIIATLLVNGAVRREDLRSLSLAKDRIFHDLSGIERVHVDADQQSVGGLSGLRTWLERERPLLTADLRSRKMRPPRGVLLVGVPGCGKSLSAKAIAREWEMPLYRLDLASIQGMYVGQSESRLREALAAADHVAPCVLWIDEIEKGLAGASGGGDSGVTARLVGYFLYWLQESRSRVFVVATANDVSRLPVELLRRGRFDELFFVDLPDLHERGEILDIYADRYLATKLESGLRDELVRLSDGFSGADIEAAVRDVAKEAIRLGDDAVNHSTWIEAFTAVVPLSKTSPEHIAAIRDWGRERAVSASGVRRRGEGRTDQIGRAVLV